MSQLIQTFQEMVADSEQGMIGSIKEERNVFCFNLADYLKQMCEDSGLILPVDPGGKLGQFGLSDHGGGHGPPWKGKGGPLVSAGKDGDRGSDILIPGCVDREHLSSLPNGFKPCGQSADLESTHETAAPSSQACLEGQTEHRDTKMPMATSALFVRFLAQGSVWQLPSEYPVQENEEAAVSVEFGLSAEPEDRRADAFVGEVENLVGNGGHEQRMKELLRDLHVGLNDIKKALEEADKGQSVTTVRAEEC
jgi:hypothetical protein